MSVVQYWLFCDFDGTVKRNRVKIYNAEYVSPITPKYDRILKKSIKENPKEYASFVKLSKTPKEVKGHVVVNYALAENDKEEVAQNLNAIRENLHPKFTFMDFVKVAQEGQCVINMNNVLMTPLMLNDMSASILFINSGTVLVKEYSSMIWILKLKEVGSK